MSGGFRPHVSASRPWAVAMGLCGLLLLASARAEVVINTPESWSGVGTGGWSDALGGAAVSNPGGQLQITFPGVNPWDPPDPASVRTIGAPATSMFVGDYAAAGATNAAFDFFAEDVLPGFVQLQFRNSTNSHTWKYNVNVGSTGSWETVVIPFDYAAGWLGGPGWNNADQFLADLHGVDWIGIYIERGSVDGQDYYLDDFELRGPLDFPSVVIPEPGQICMLLSAGLTLGLALRSRRPSHGEADVPS